MNTSALPIGFSCSGHWFLLLGCGRVRFQDRAQVIVFREVSPFPRREFGLEMGLQALEVADLATDGLDAVPHDRGDLLARLRVMVQSLRAGTDEL
jgi:hypothetical protein